MTRIAFNPSRFPAPRLRSATVVLFSAALLMACSSPPLHQLPQPDGEVAELLVEVDNIGTQSGFIAIAVYHHPEGFPGTPYDVALAAIVDGTAIRPFRLPAGPYMVLAFQDENSNGRLDRKLGFLPSEPLTYAGPRRRFGPPRWEDAQVELKAGGTRLVLSMPGSN